MGRGERDHRVENQLGAVMVVHRRSNDNLEESGDNKNVHESSSKRP